MKEIKVEWCENFIRAAFGPKHHAFAGKPDAGIEVNCFWKMAQAAGLWEPGIYGGPMSQALENLTVLKSIHNNEGDFLSISVQRRRFPAAVTATQALAFAGASGDFANRSHVTPPQNDALSWPYPA